MNQRSRSMRLNFARAGFGVLGGQLLNLLAIPLIARIYAPEAYSLWAVVIATSAMFGAIASCRYELAIVVPEQDEEASVLLVGCLLSSVITGILTFCGVIALSASGLFRIESGISVYVALLVTSTGFNLALQHWFVRRQAYTTNSVGQILLASVTAAVQIAYGSMVAADAMGLIYGSLLGQGVLLSFLAASARSGHQHLDLSLAAVSQLPAVLARHFRFPAYAMPYTFFGQIRERAGVYVLAAFMADRDIGFYALAYRVLHVPVSLVSASIRPVMFTEASRNGVAAMELYVNQTLRLIVWGATPFIVAFFFLHEQLFTIVLGEEWREASSIALILVLPASSYLFSNWLDRFMDVLDQQRTSLLLQVVFGLLSVLVLWGGLSLNQGLTVALSMQACVIVIFNFVYLFVVYQRAGFNRILLLSHAALILAVAASASLIGFAVRHAFS